MPLYAFRCASCDHQFEQLLSLRDDQGAVRCPECDSVVRRLITTFATSSGSGGATSQFVGGG